jgi:hypothetical protein
VPFNSGDYAIENTVPLPQLPNEICFEIWKYLSKRDIAIVSKVSRSWKNFTIPFFLKELSNCGHRNTYSQRVCIGLHDETRELTYNLKTLFLTSEGWAENSRNLIGDSDAVIYVFPKGKNTIFKFY